MTKDESAYLERVRDSIARIEKYTSGMDELAFMTDELVQDAVIRQLQIIGEAAKKLSDGTKDQGIIFRCSVERHHRKVLRSCKDLVGGYPDASTSHRLR